MPGLIQHFEDEADGAENKAHQERTDGPLPVQARPENPENKAHRNRRADVRLHALQIDIELRAEQVNERHPEKAENDHGARRDPPEKDELRFSGSGPEFLIEIERYHR